MAKHPLLWTLAAAVLWTGPVAFAQTPTLTEYSVETVFGLAAEPRGVALGPDGAVWFGERVAGHVGRIDTGGAITYFATTGGLTSKVAIVTGPDGNLWVGGDGVFRVTPQDTVTLFALPPYPGLPAGNSVESIAWDGADSIWFVELIQTSKPDSRRIGRIRFVPDADHTLQPQLLEDFLLPAGAGNPGFDLHALTKGSDGKMWFTDTTQLVRIDGVDSSATPPAAIVTAFPLPNLPGFAQSGTAQRITSGPDGKLWFSVEGLSPANVGAIESFDPKLCPTPAAASCAVPDIRIVPDAARHVRGLTFGPDGNLWFLAAGTPSQSQPDLVSSMAPDGSGFHSIALPNANSGPLNITPGPAGDNSLWFTETSGNRIGRISGIPGLCGTTALCLQQNRFRVQVAWRVPPQGTSGQGVALPIAPDTGAFWFFSANNLELMVKVLDGRAINGHWWVFYGALSNVEYTITVTDMVTGAVQTYRNPFGLLGSHADTAAFSVVSPPPHEARSSDHESRAVFTDLHPADLVRAELSAPPATSSEMAASTCTPDAISLCLTAARFKVQVAWNVPLQGSSGVGTASALTGDTGTFWFFSSNNLELIIKVLDARGVNNHFWVFFGALSNVEYTITVTDTVTGTVKTYINPDGTLASVADTSAF